MSFSNKFIRRNSLAIANKKINKFFRQRDSNIFKLNLPDKKKKKQNKKIEKNNKEKKIEKTLIIKKIKKSNAKITLKSEFKIKEEKENLKIIFNPKKKIFKKIKIKKKTREKIHEPEILLIIR